MKRLTHGFGRPAFGRSMTWVLVVGSAGLSVHACNVDKGEYSFGSGGGGGTGGLAAATAGAAGEGAGPASASTAGEAGAIGEATFGGATSSPGSTTGGGATAGGATAGGSSAAGSPSDGAGGGGKSSCGTVVCAREAECIPTTEPPRCECDDGYLDVQGDGSSCLDIDECATDNGGCDPLTECSNTPGSFTCGDCPLGYQAGSDGGCVDIDECASDNGGCDPSVACTNTDGAFTCGDCPAGYSGGGVTGCVDIDECATNNGGCHAKADCTNMEGSRKCTCQEGYMGNGTSCTCAVTAPECVNSTMQRSCVGNTLTQTPCAGPSPLCVAGQGCQSCSTQRCGTTCCAAPPANAVSTCSPSDTCSLQCSSGYHGCNGSQPPCYADNDAARCGDNCTDCNQPNAIAKCEGGACSNTCRGPTLGCVISAGKPACGSWSFESKTTENFTLDTKSTTSSDGVFKAMQRRASDGSYSLAIGYDGTDASTGDVVEFKIPLCPGGQGLNLADRVLRMDMYHETASGSQPYPNNRSGHYIRAFNGSDLVNGCDVYPNSDTPSVVECPNSTTTPITSFSVMLRIFDPSLERHDLHRQCASGMSPSRCG